MMSDSSAGDPGYVRASGTGDLILNGVSWSDNFNRTPAWPEPIRSPSIEDRLTTIEQLLASAAEITRQLQEMLRQPTVTVSGPCAHPTEYLVGIPRMGDAPQNFLCRRCQTVVEPED